VDLRFRSLVAGTGIAVTQNTNDVTIDADAFAGTVSLGVFGSGADGNLVFDGTSVVAGITPSAVGATAYRFGAIQQYVLTRDLHCDDLQVNSGVLVFNDGYRIFVKGTLTLNGIIGSPGVNGATGAAITQAARTNTLLSCRLPAGGNSVPGA
jgi:hypothetical protein